MRDLARIRALGRTRPFVATAIVVGEPSTPEKEDFITREATIIREQNGSALEPFANKLLARGRG